jgi:hypothetical protein
MIANSLVMQRCYTGAFDCSMPEVSPGRVDGIAVSCNRNVAPGLLTIAPLLSETITRELMSRGGMMGHRGMGRMAQDEEEASPQRGIMGLGGMIGLVA